MLLLVKLDAADKSTVIILYCLEDTPASFTMRWAVGSEAYHRQGRRRPGPWRQRLPR